MFLLFFSLYEMNHLPLSIQHQQCESVALGHSGFRPTRRPVSMFCPGRPFIYFFDDDSEENILVSLIFRGGGRLQIY